MLSPFVVNRSTRLASFLHVAALPGVYSHSLLPATIGLVLIHRLEGPVILVEVLVVFVEIPRGNGMIHQH